MSFKKNDENKPRLGLIPREALEAMAYALVHGAREYGTHNWRQGCDWSRFYDAAYRHLLAWIDGVDKDSFSGLSHLAHAMASISFLIVYQAKQIGNDDRYKPETLKEKEYEMECYKKGYVLECYKEKGNPT